MPTLYRQYESAYRRGGKQAMEDTMANAAALTGGYGNSYASTAGNQAYQSYLAELNQILPCSIRAPTTATAIPMGMCWSSWGCCRSWMRGNMKNIGTPWPTIIPTSTIIIGSTAICPSANISSI